MENHELLNATIDRLGEDRRAVIRFMILLGWSVKRLKAKKNVSWEFTRPDTGGLWDTARVSQSNISWDWCMRICLGNEQDFNDLVRAAFKKWRASK